MPASPAPEVEVPEVVVVADVVVVEAEAEVLGGVTNMAPFKELVPGLRRLVRLGVVRLYQMSQIRQRLTLREVLEGAVVGLHQEDGREVALAALVAVSQNALKVLCR